MTQSKLRSYGGNNLLIYITITVIVNRVRQASAKYDYITWNKHMQNIVVKEFYDTHYQFYTNVNIFYEIKTVELYE